GPPGTSNVRAAATVAAQSVDGAFRPRGSPGPMPANIQLLLVDDNPMVLGMLRQALAPLANVTTAEDGGDALLKAIESPPDLIVSDYAMSGVDGTHLLNNL